MELRLSPTDAQIRRWYSLQLDFAISDQRLFNIPLELHLDTSPQSKKTLVNTGSKIP
jgi:hypothetical protein